MSIVHSFSYKELEDDTTVDRIIIITADKKASISVVFIHFFIKKLLQNFEQVQ